MVTKLAGCNIYKDNSVLMLHRIDSNHWEFPGGKVREGEDLEGTALRETEEEIGCRVRIIRYLGPVKFNHKDKEFESNQFDSEIVEGFPKINENNIFDDLRYIPFKELENIKLAPNVKIYYEKYLKGKIK